MIRGLWVLGGPMGTIIRFPKQSQDAAINFYGLELFVKSCGKFLNTLPTETRAPAKQEFNRLVDDLLQFIDAFQEARRSE
jgi:hypothetical protein